MTSSHSLSSPPGFTYPWRALVGRKGQGLFKSPSVFSVAASGPSPVLSLQLSDMCCQLRRDYWYPGFVSSLPPQGWAKVKWNVMLSLCDFTYQRVLEKEVKDCQALLLTQAGYMLNSWERFHISQGQYPEFQIHPKILEGISKAQPSSFLTIQGLTSPVQNPNICLLRAHNYHSQLWRWEGT